MNNDIKTAEGLPVGVPDGWVLVPFSPTGAMLEELTNGSHAKYQVMKMRYRAMLAAAPAAPTVKAEQVQCEECGGNGAGGAHEDDCSKAPSLPAAGSADLTASQCACGDEYPANSYGAGFMAANNGICENCDAANSCASEPMPAAGSADQPYPDGIADDLERSDWTPIEALQWYATGKHFDVVGGRTRIIDTGAVASNALKHASLAYLELKGDAELSELRAALSAQQSARQPELTVWEGPMPESNGKSNFTAVLMRKGANLFDGIAGGMTIARSEYPDRVRYEADCVRWLIGELDNEPCIIDYDADKHSGYVSQQSAPERVSVLCEALEDARRAMFAVLNQEPRMKAVAKRVLNAEIDRIDRALLSSHGRGEA